MPAIEKPFQAFAKAKQRFTETGERRVLTGPLMLADTPIYRKDDTYGLYQLLQGSLALRILSAVVGIFVIWKLVGLLGLTVLKTILDQVLGVGAIALVILFAPEIRRFLLIIGKNTILDRLRLQL